MSRETTFKTKDKLLVAFVIFFIILIGYFWFSPSGLKVVPNLNLTTTTGETIKLEALRGRPVLVTFWATSCSGCIKEMPHLIDIHNQYSQKGLKIIGISMPYDRPDQVMKMASQKKLPYTIAMDISKEAVKAFGNVQLTPTTFLIAPNGTIVRHKVGEFNTQVVTKHIEQLLASTSMQSKTSHLKPANDVRKN